MARLLAVLAAIGMIAGAFVYRYGVPGGGDGDGPGGTGGNGGDGSAAVVCASELGEAVCAAAGDDVLVEPAATTADRLIAVRSAAEADVAGWVAPGPWPAMVDDARTRASRPALFSTKPTTVASAPIVAVLRKDQVPPACAASVTWRCLGDAAQDPAFRIGGDPAGTSGGLFLRAGALAAFFGDTAFAINDLDASADAQTWYANLNARLAAAPGFGARTLESFVLQRGSAAVYVTGGAGVRLGGAVEFTVATPAPPVTIAVTYTPAAREGRELDVGPLRDPLRDAGWKVQSPSPTQGLPSPGVLLALRSS